MKPNLKKQQGSIVYVLIIAMAIAASVLAMHFQTLGQISANDIAQQRLLQVLETKKATINEALMNGQSWLYTMQASAPDSSYGTASNSNLTNCTNSPSYACSTTPFNIVLANSENTVLNFISSGTGTRGFDRTGAACNNYSAAGNADCPFRYVLQVVADCSMAGVGAVTCSQPYRLLVTANLEFSANSYVSYQIKASKYSFTVEK